MQNISLAVVTSSVINIIMLFILLYIIIHNEIMSVGKTKAYIAVIILTIIVMTTEMLATVFDQCGANFRIPNIIVNIVGFSLSTFIPVILAVVFDEKLFKIIKLICIPIALNFVLTVSSAWFKWIFYVSVNNNYTRGPLFSVYIITYLYGLVLLMISNYHQSLQFQNTDRIYLMMLYLIFLIGTTVQVLFPFIHSTWHCITLVLVMYYLFQREMEFKYDMVTKLLNRQAFEKKLKSLSEMEHACIIVFDLDKFKSINDNYGHAKGDYGLKQTAGIIKNSFQKIGQCYRIGGDEFCVLAQNFNEHAIQECIKIMLQSIQKVREKDPIIPIVSYGYSFYCKSEQGNILQSFQDADDKMYILKKRQ